MRIWNGGDPYQGHSARENIQDPQLALAHAMNAKFRQRRAGIETSTTLAFVVLGLAAAGFAVATWLRLVSLSSTVGVVVGLGIFLLLVLIARVVALSLHAVSVRAFADEFEHNVRNKPYLARGSD